MALDGTDKITPTPFDAHEKVVRGPHTHSLKDGYQPVKPAALVEAAEPAAEPAKPAAE